MVLANKEDAGKKEVKLNLGCGYKKREGFLTVDFNPVYKPDVLCDLTKFPWPFEDESVDYIYSSFCLEHMAVPLTNVLHEAYRIMKPNGKFHLITTNNFYYKNRLLFLTGNYYLSRDSVIQHSMILKPSQFEFMFRNHGFSRVNFNITSGIWGKIGFEQMFRDLFAQRVDVIATK